MQVTQYIAYDDYTASLLLAEGRLSGDEMLEREELPLGELIVQDVLLALSEYMPEVEREWVRMLFVANSELNRTLTESVALHRIELGWMYANLVIDLHKKSGNA